MSLASSEPMEDDLFVRRVIYMHARTPLLGSGHAMLRNAEPSNPVFFKCKTEASCHGGMVVVNGSGLIEDAFRCADGHVNGSSLCSRCEPGFAWRNKQCKECTQPAGIYWFTSLALVAAWFPILREILTKWVKSL